MRDPAETLRRLHLDYGPVVAFGVGPFRYVALFGPDANRYVLVEHPENFRWREALRTLIPVVGDTALVVSDGDEHARRRRIVQPAFSTRRIIGYLDVMTRTVDEELDTWLPGRRLDAFTRLRAVVRKVAIAALFGETLGGRSDELGDALAAAIDFVNLPVTHQIRVDLPWTRWHKAKTAREHADRMVSEELARRRRNPSSHPTDVLAMLINVDDAAKGLSDAEIRDQVVSLVAAGYDTTSAAAAWAVHELLANPGQWDRTATEVQRIAGNGRFTIERLAALHHLDAVVNETLRKWPPGFVSARHVVTTFDFDGYTIPQGSTVLFSPYVTHRDPRTWPDPDRFDPDRWRTCEPDPYAFIPFGGSYRRCIGFAFATLELKVVLARLLQRVRLTPEQLDNAAVGIAALHPKHGVPVRVDACAGAATATPP